MNTPAPRDASVPVPAGCDTLAKLFRHRVQERDASTAMCDKRRGIWVSISWREYGEQARARHHRAPDRHHLLFAAGEVAGVLAPAFLQA